MVSKLKMMSPKKQKQSLPLKDSKTPKTPLSLESDPLSVELEIKNVTRGNQIKQEEIDFEEESTSNKKL